jgi:hypothetical protein
MVIHVIIGSAAIKVFSNALLIAGVVYLRRKR